MAKQKKMNKTLKQILYKKINEHNKDWLTQLTYSLWAYNISIHTSTRNTSYNLVYSVEKVMTLELEIPSLRISLRGIIENNTYKEQHLQ